MRIVQVEAMRSIEAQLDRDEVSYADLMVRAGEALARQVLHMVGHLEAPRVLILVGGGNNGGDGLVGARFLKGMRADVVVQVYMVMQREDALVEALTPMDIVIANAVDDKDRRVLRHMAMSADVVIDALCGIGVRLPLRDDVTKILRQVGAAIDERRGLSPDFTTVDPARGLQIATAPPLQVLAVDCPSGVDCDTGEVDKHTLGADVTLTFIAVKQGLVMLPAASYVGDLYVADCGIGRDHVVFNDVTDRMIDARYVRELLPVRDKHGHKGTFGKALLVCGCVHYVGAVGLASEGAYRSGAGLVTVATARPVAQMLAGVHLEPTWLSLPHDMGVIHGDASVLVLEHVAAYQAMLLGCGLGTERVTGDFVRALLGVHRAAAGGKKRIGFQVDETRVEASGKVDLPGLVVDADGLNLLAEIERWWEFLPEGSIITPHVGEMARLAGVDNAFVMAHRWDMVAEKARAWDVTIVLKGAHTLIATPEGGRFVLPFKLDGLGTAGTGDVLAGLIVGFRAQGLDAWQAAVCGAYVHGLAGALASEDRGARSLMARDVLIWIGEALKQLEKS